MSGTRLTFFLRLTSTIGLWALILATIFSGNEVAFFVVISGMALVALWEYFKMLEHDKIPCFRVTGMICAAVFMTGSFYYFSAYGPGRALDFELVIMVLFLMVMFGRQMFASMRDREPLQTMAYTLFGLLYIPWLFNFVAKILFLTPRSEDGSPTGQYYVLFLVLVTKFSDMGAYIFGSVFGKHPLVPHISPKKTWEGLAGALACAMLGSFWLAFLMPDRLKLFDLMDFAVLGFVLGLAAIIGDLAESIVKRSAHSKDSSSVLPGIGGTLDLIDSLLFTAPILYFYMRLVLGIF
jgi:phosphatidate cytidylyltransferase